MIETDPMTGRSKFHRILRSEPAEPGWWSIVTDEKEGEIRTAIAHWAWMQEGWNNVVNGRTVGEEWVTDDDGNRQELKVGLALDHEICPGEYSGFPAPYDRKFIGWRYDPDHVAVKREFNRAEWERQDRIDHPEHYGGSLEILSKIDGTAQVFLACHAVTLVVLDDDALISTAVTDHFRSVHGYSGDDVKVIRTAWECLDCGATFPMPANPDERAAARAAHFAECPRSELD